VEGEAVEDRWKVVELVVDRTRGVVGGGLMKVAVAEAVFNKINKKGNRNG
jgi:hypothetical protein